MGKVEVRKRVNISLNETPHNAIRISAAAQAVGMKRTDWLRKLVMAEVERIEKAGTDD